MGSSLPSCVTSISASDQSFHTPPSKPWRRDRPGKVVTLGSMAGTGASSSDGEAKGSWGRGLRVAHRAVRREALCGHLGEKGRRLLAAAEARTVGWGGVERVGGITGLARPTIGRGRDEPGGAAFRARHPARATLAAPRARWPARGEWMARAHRGHGHAMSATAETAEAPGPRYSSVSRITKAWKEALIPTCVEFPSSPLGKGDRAPELMRGKARVASERQTTRNQSLSMRVGII